MVYRWLVACVGVALTLATIACGPASTPTGSSGSAPRAAQTNASGTAAPSTSGGASASPQWDQVLASAKAEGSAVLMGPPSDAWRKAATEAFTNQFGIQLEYFGVPTSENGARLQREAAAKKLSFDVDMTGAICSSSPIKTSWSR